MNENFDIHQFLVSLHPEESLQFIIAVFAAWLEDENKKRFGKFDKLSTTRNFLLLLRQELDAQLSARTSQTMSNRSDDMDIVSVSKQTLKKNQNSTLFQMKNMSPDDAMSFLAETTASWCFSSQKKLTLLGPITLMDTNDKSIAEAIHVWFTRYFDLWS